ncbi:MAG TPA: CAP domain-containing protein [Syntrophorhabdales bacterium]|nr:CAP domain-containing protein [Syntrophorhabdales bacterium]
MADYINDWYYMQPNWHGHSFVRGPLSAGALYALLEKGEINGKTQVRCGNKSLWHPLDDVLPLITQLATSPKQKADWLAFWRRHKAELLIAFLIADCLIVGKHLSHWIPVGERSQLQLGTHNAANFERQYHGQEVLSKEAVVSLTNNARALNGLGALSENQLLDTVAEERAEDMLEKQYFAHISPTGEQASDVAQRVGYRYKILAENLASGTFLTNQKLIDGWMQSPGHRQNILSPEVQDIGVAVVKGKLMGADAWVSVQIFGLQSPSVSEKVCTPPPQQLLHDIEAKKAEVKILNDSLTRLREELDAEKGSIESDRMSVGSDAQRKFDLNARITAYNAKSSWHNQSLQEIRAKEALVNSMVEEYNRVLQNYKDCLTSS